MVKSKQHVSSVRKLRVEKWRGGTALEDARIVELYWERDEAAIAESSAKYGGYCYQIAFRILAPAGGRGGVRGRHLAAGLGGQAAQPPRAGWYVPGEDHPEPGPWDRWRALRAQKRWPGTGGTGADGAGGLPARLRRRGTGGGGRRPGGEPEPLFGIPAPGETGAVCPSVLVSLLRGGAGRLERQAAGGRSPRRCSACGRTCRNTWRGRDSPYDKGTAAGCCGRYPGCVHPGGRAAARLVPQAAGIPLDRRGGGPAWR